jgi:hypothetical protein
VNRYRNLDAFAGFRDLPLSLPRRMAEDGYQSLFFTTGDLGFLGKGEWLQTLGFDYIEGNDHAFYQGMQRHAFGAAHDGHLFDRVLAWYAEERAPGQAFVAIVETVTTHPPFAHPETGVQDEQSAFRFTDREVARFVGALEQAGYFDHGLLVITSDQRALSALRPQERERFGNSAPALLPMLVLGQGFEGGRSVGNIGQMQDFPHSVDQLLTPQACAPSGSGLLFSRPARSPACILRPQGNQRDIVDAWCGTSHRQVLLDGDDTRVLDDSDIPAQALIETINWQRIRQGEQASGLAAIL